jgi:O-antigen ligase
MSAHALVVMLVVSSLFFLSIVRHPYWGLISYIFIYYNIPHSYINWWAVDLPEIRWSLIACIVVLFSMTIHRDNLNAVKMTKCKNFNFLILLTLIMLLLTPFSVNYLYSSEKLYDFFRYTVCFYMIVKCVTDIKKIEILIWVCMLCCFNLSWDAYSMTGYNISGRLEGIGTPDSFEANTFATVLLVAIPFLLNELIFESKARKVCALVMSIFIINALILCGSRGAFVGLVGILLVFTLFNKNKKHKKNILLGVLFVGVLFVRLIDPSYISRLASFDNGQDQTGSGRTIIWKYGLAMVKDYPLGTGGYGFEYLSPDYIPEILLFGGRRAPHNTYLLLLVEQGFIGLCLFIFFLIYTFKMLHIAREKDHMQKNINEIDLEKIKRYSLATEAAISGILISGFFVDRLYFEVLYWLAAISTVLYVITPEAQHVKEIAG